MDRATPDYNEYLSGLRRFMKSQDEMMDYDFDGSALSFLAKALAYDATNQGFYNAMMFNEMHSSAEMRENLGSLISFITYIPGSVRGSTSVANITVTPSDTLSAPSQITLSRHDKFTAGTEGEVFPHVPKEDYTAQFDGTQYVFNNVELIQGKRISTSFDVNGTTIVSNTIPNEDIDIDTLIVGVRESATVATTTPFRLYENGYDLGEDRPIFYLNLNRQNRYDLSFGDGVLSRQLADGNIIIAEYVVSQGAASNGIKTILPMTAIDGYTNIQVDVIQPSTGGRHAETADEIRNRAPRSVWSGGAIINPIEYKHAIKDRVSGIVDAISWGGEESVPPQAGSVFIAAIPDGGGALTDQHKADITAAAKPHNVGSVSVVVVDADETRIQVETNVTFDPTWSSLDTRAVELLVANHIRSYSTNSLQSFGSDFDFSLFSNHINETDDSIVGNVTDVTYTKLIIPELNYPGSYSTSFNRPLGKGTVLINGFDAEEGGGTYSTFIRDIDGTLYLFLIDEVGDEVQLRSVGSVDYSTGLVTIGAIRVTSVADVHMNVNAKSANLDRNIHSQTGVYVSIDDVQVSVTIKGS